MNTASLQPGDIIEVNRKGRHFYAVFNRKLAIGARLAEGFAGELVITPLDARVTYRAATAREVVGIWRATKATRARSCTRNDSDLGGVAKNEMARRTDMEDEIREPQRTKALRTAAIALVDKIARDCDMVDAHADGMHDDLPREGCPECER